MFFFGFCLFDLLVCVVVLVVSVGIFLVFLDILVV